MKKVLFVASVTGHIRAFHLPYLKLFKDQGYQVDVAAKENAELPQDYNVHAIPFERSPLRWNNISAYKQIKKIIVDNNYDIIHCHTPVAALITRIAARKSRKNGTKVIYTAHGFHFYEGAPLKNWLLYYPVEKLCAHFTDILITINKEDYARAQKKFRAKEVVYVPGVGVDLNKFGASKIDKVEKRRELGIPEGAPWLLNIGELIPRKNQETLIRAVADIPNVYLTIAGRGILEQHLRELVCQLGVEDRVKILGFRTDINDLCHASDAYVFASFHEGLPVAVMESMANGLPCVVSRIRGNVDLIDESGGVLFDPYDEVDCRNAIQKLLSMDLKSMGDRNKTFIKNFSIDSVMTNMRHLYNV